MHSVLSCMVSEEIAPGRLVNELIDTFKGISDMELCAAIRDPFFAIELLIEAFGIQSGDSVVISPLSPSYFFEVLSDAGIRVLFADVDSGRPVLTLESVKRVLTPSASLIILSHSLGYIPNARDIASLGVPFVEDISESLNLSDGKTSVGLWGEGLFVSLESDKVITSGGGALLSMRQKTKAAEKALAEIAKERILPDFNAALAIPQIRKLPSASEKRNEIERTYINALASGRHSTFAFQSSRPGRTPLGFPVLLDRGMKEAQRYAEKHGVESYPAFADSCIARHPDETAECPHARNGWIQSLLFPLYADMGKDDITNVARVLTTLP